MVENFLVEKLETGNFSFFNTIILSQLNHRLRKNNSLAFLCHGAEFNPQIFGNRVRTEILALIQCIHQRLYSFQFLFRLNNSILTNIPSFPFIEIIRKARNQKELRYKNLFLFNMFLRSTIKHSFKNRLFSVAYGQSITFFVVLDKS